MATLMKIGECRARCTFADGGGSDDRANVEGATSRSSRPLATVNGPPNTCDRTLQWAVVRV